MTEESVTFDELASDDVDPCELADRANEQAARAIGLIEQGEWAQAAADLAGATEAIVEATRESRKARDDTVDVGLEAGEPSLSLPVVLTDAEAYTARKAAHADSWELKDEIRPEQSVAWATRRQHGYHGPTTDRAALEDGDR